MENDKLLRALKKENTGRPPFWFMRQAGRYQPSYQLLRAKYSIETLFHTPELIAQVTMLPVNELFVDAAILFSDILIPLEMLGYSVRFPQGGPVVEPETIHPPRKRGVEAVCFVEQAIHLLKRELKVPLIGFCGGPFTVASYIFREKVKGIKKHYFHAPHAVHALLEEITQVSITYLQMQEAAGAQVIQLFDSWAGTLPRELVGELSIPYLQRLVAAVKIPVIVFSRGAGHHPFEETGAACVSLDWTTPVSEVRKRMPDIVLQGNLDPEVLYGPQERIAKEALNLVESMKGDAGFILNLGHGLLPDIPYENVQFLAKVFRDMEAYHTCAS